MWGNESDYDRFVYSFRFDNFVFLKISQLSTILLLCTQSKFSLSLEQLFKWKQLVLDRPCLGKAKLRIKTKIFMRIYTKWSSLFKPKSLSFVCYVPPLSYFLFSLPPLSFFTVYGAAQAARKRRSIWLGGDLSLLESFGLWTGSAVENNSILKKC